MKLKISEKKKNELVDYLTYKIKDSEDMERCCHIWPTCNYLFLTEKDAKIYRSEKHKYRRLLYAMNNSNLQDGLFEILLNTEAELLQLKSIIADTDTNLDYDLPF